MSDHEHRAYEVWDGDRSWAPVSLEQTVKRAGGSLTVDNRQVTAAVDALWVVKPTGKDRKLAARCVERLLGADCGDILAYLGLS